MVDHSNAHLSPYTRETMTWLWEYILTLCVFGALSRGGVVLVCGCSVVCVCGIVARCSCGCSVFRALNRRDFDDDED